MADALRIAGLAVVGLIAIWVLFELIAIVVGLVSWVVSTAITLAMLGLALYIGYLLVSHVRN